MANKSLNTCCFSGRIKCPHCGCSYMHNRRTKNGSYQEYWNCGSRKKKKVGDGCPVNGSISQKALEKACAEVLGLEAFDEDVFLARVDHIEVPKVIPGLFLKDGTVIRRMRQIPVIGTAGHRNIRPEPLHTAGSMQLWKEGGILLYVQNQMCRVRMQLPGTDTELLIHGRRQDEALAVQHRRFCLRHSRPA